jgi:gamma-glutamyltranspeptidase/glutathione hydrolase
MLNMLEAFDLQSMGYHSSNHFHTLVEIMKRAFADRAVYLGDPDFTDVPVETLISKERAATAAKSINMETAIPSKQIQMETISMKESDSTTHSSIVDADGNVVSNTYTMNDSFGSGVTVPNAGFLLNDEMDDFTSKPGVPNAYRLLQSERNAIAPRKRPLSSMTPVIVLKNGKPFLVLGGPGGSTIITSVLQVLLNVVDFQMDIQQAVDEPRFHHQWMPDEIYLEPFEINTDTRKILEKRGHKFADKPFMSDSKYIGDVQGILIDPLTGLRWGACDPRRGGVPAGY